MDTPRLITHRDGLAWLCKPAGWNTHPTAEGGIDVVTWLDTQGKLLKGKGNGGKYDAVGQDTTQMDDDAGAGMDDNLDKFAFQ